MRTIVELVGYYMGGFKEVGGRGGGVGYSSRRWEKEEWGTGDSGWDYIVFGGTSLPLLPCFLRIVY